MLRSLVGSEMCIRDSHLDALSFDHDQSRAQRRDGCGQLRKRFEQKLNAMGKPSCALGREEIRVEDEERDHFTGCDCIEQRRMIVHTQILATKPDQCTHGWENLEDNGDGSKCIATDALHSPLARVARYLAISLL